MNLINDKKREAVIYPESTSYSCEAVLLAVQQNFSKWAYILHDDDKNEDGELKKAHFHVLFRSNRSYTPNGVAYTLGVPLSALCNVKSWKAAVRYMVHLDDPEKYPYPFEDIVSNFPVKPLLVPDDDEEKAKRIYQFLSQNPYLKDPV